ncbi:MAG: hypothetical protein OXK80_03010 [Bdellovibrionales bacterium]|nr:hypothetical protein [Bdellovibrionales bacterium]
MRVFKLFLLFTLSILVLNTFASDQKCQKFFSEKNDIGSVVNSHEIQQAFRDIIEALRDMSSSNYQAQALANIKMHMMQRGGAGDFGHWGGYSNPSRHFLHGNFILMLDIVIAGVAFKLQQSLFISKLLNELLDIDLPYLKPFNSEEFRRTLIEITKGQHRTSLKSVLTGMDNHLINRNFSRILDYIINYLESFKGDKIENEIYKSDIQRVERIYNLLYSE